MTSARGLSHAYADYLRLAEGSPVKLEFLDGEIYAMAGGTPEHAALAARLTVLIGRRIQPPCRVHSSDRPGSRLNIPLMRRAWLALALLAPACGPGTPSDDPADWEVDTSVAYVVTASAPRFVVPSLAMPPEVGLERANNNVEIVFHQGRLFMAWRQAETHFAGPDVKMQVVSSPDEGLTWDYEATIAIGTDVREPRFVSMQGELHLYYFESGDNPITFRPKNMWRITRRGPREWSAPEKTGRDKEVPWDLKVRGGVAYMTSYSGAHYGVGEGAVQVYFQSSQDGLTWAPVDPERVASYSGGVSEVAFELDEAGDAWFVTRNEDGDETGFGSHVCFASRANLADWACPAQADPERYDSPELFRHGQDLYLVARRDIGGPFDQGRPGTVDENRQRYLLDYSTRPKRSALYRIDRGRRRVEHLMDLPGVGDTAFASIRRTGAHTFLMANYTSPLDDPDVTWLEGQTSPRGTQLYLMTLTLTPQ